MIAAFAVIRWLHEASLMALFGDAALRMLLRARLPGAQLPRGGWRVIAAAVALASAGVWLCFATAQMAGDPRAMADLRMLRLTITGTQFGQVFVPRLALLVLLCAGAILRWRESLLATLSGAALILISVTSHAAEASPANFTAIGVISDGLHLLTGGFWLGGLALLAGLYANRIKDFAAAVAIFAEWGMVSVSVLILTGMLNAATILLGSEGHDAPLYLAMLGAKLALVVGMVTLALVNHFRLLPGLLKQGAAESAAARLNGNIKREFLLGLLVVGLAALLGLLPPTL